MFPSSWRLQSTSHQYCQKRISLNICERSKIIWAESFKTNNTSDPVTRFIKLRNTWDWKLGALGWTAGARERRPERTNENSPFWTSKFWCLTIKWLIHVANLLAFDSFGKNTCLQTNICRKMVDIIAHTAGKVEWKSVIKSWFWMPNAIAIFGKNSVAVFASLDSN